MSFVCFVTEKGSHWDYPCNHHLPDPFVRDDPREEKESLHFCGLLSSVYCIPSRTVYTERTYQRPQSGSGACGWIAKKRILSRTRSRVSGCCLRISTMSMMNDYEEDLDDFPSENRENTAWIAGLEHIAQSRQINVQQEVESQQRLHLFLMDQRPGLSTRSWSTTGWMLQCLMQKNEAQHWGTDLSETASNLWIISANVTLELQFFLHW